MSDEIIENKEKYLSFEVKENDYAIQIKYVDDIIGFQEITEVPDMPDYFRGIINLRGQIIPIIDVRGRFQIETIEYHARTCIIVVSLNETTVGLVVDEVHEVLDISENEIQPTSSKENKSFINALAKVNGEVKLLIELEKMLDKETNYALDLEEILT